MKIKENGIVLVYLKDSKNVILILVFNTNKNYYLLIDLMELFAKYIYYFLGFTRLEYDPSNESLKLLVLIYLFVLLIFYVQKNLLSKIVLLFCT
jgi:hypothetical protein